MARAADFDLAKELGKPSFTPAQRDAPALVELVIADHDKAAAVLAKLGDAARAALAARLDLPDEGGRARVVAALGLLARAGDGAARTELLARVTDPGVRVRRAAESALGKLGGDDARDALLARLAAGDAPPDELRTLVEALGKLGGPDVLARLRALDPGRDAELARRRDRALLMIERDAGRTADSTIDATVALPFVVRLRCKTGLGALLVEELGRTARVDASTDSWVETRVARWDALWQWRLWATAGLRVPLRGSRRDASDAEVARAIVDALTAPDVRNLLRAMTRGPIRWRLGFPSGHRRALVWHIARDVAARAPELVNDPTQTVWDVLVDEGALELVPRRADDPRFAWRVAEVPAASHPTVAAALAFVAGAQAGERVWDPFCGSGAELVERARLGPCTLLGTDLDETALAAARENLAAAKVDAKLAIADARTHAPPPVDLIVTNPPLGSRVHVDAAALLVAALPGFARALAPRGRLVWITPAAKHTNAAAERAGLRLARDVSIDLGGVRGRLQRWDRIAP
ncbi:MAG: methyltransferase domain-containing protein [Deltaproteobacteria bacterium]|nr:methyltransferase domain-containing protein [Deltaproteobacteria bacterium]